LTKQCTHPGPVVVSGADVQLLEAGTVDISSIAPDSARAIAISVDGAEYPLRKGLNELPVGDYTLRVSAEGYAPHQGRFTVFARKTNLLGDLALQR